ncbi:MAG TPA: amino acid adenylation domain-containing protein, partial [Thermoanaerobaculia bacterium]
QSGRAGDPAGLAAFSLGASGARVELDGLTLESVRLPERRAQLDLTLLAAEDPDGGLGVSLEFNADLFDGGTAERMLGHLRTLLEGALAAPETPVRHLPLLTPAERRQLLAEWNPAPAAAGPRRALRHSLHNRFEAQVDRAPEAVALSFGDERLTYGELEAGANRLAHHLQDRGVRPGDRVALLLERSAEMVVAILAVLKAGAAYVPVDPTYPAERIAFTLEDSGAALVLRVDDLAGEAVDRQSRERPALAVDPELPAYVIYTSGSTGRPKGVVVTHANADRLLTATDAWFGFGADDVWTLFHSYAFDFSVWEIWGALLYGGRLVVVPYWTSRSPEGFYRLLRDERVTVLNQTPSAFRQLLWAEETELGGAAPELSLRWVIFGGEALEPASLAPWFARHGDARPRLINMYGITETTVHVTWRPVLAADLDGGSRIGRPIPDLAVYLLDANLEAVPVGVPGEIHVGGAGLAQGYLNRPDLTAGRFIPDPFATAPGARLYRSGDLARRLPDGDLEYLGRIDSQVKIRGFRVELGEIEAALAAHPGVREAVVVARDGGQGDERRLAAYVVPAGVPAAELRAFLRETLPDFMVPTAFVGLDALPLSPTGKIDRRALPEPEEAAGEPAAAGFRTPVEEMLAGVVAEVLGVERVGPHDDFFALGGHSLLATRLLARVSRLFGVDLPVSSVFQYPTVASLAERIAAVSSDAVPPVLPVPPVPRPDGWAMPLSFAQRGLWLIDRLTPGSPAYHLPGAVRLCGPLDLATLKEALAGVVARHEALRTVFPVLAGEPWQVLDAPAVALPQVDLAALPAEAAEAEAGRLAQEVAVAPFDLARGPLWRVVALRVSPVDHLLAITLHHIVADGWSLDILVAELAALYGAAVAGRRAALPALPVQYADW